ncbi:hypothetical protein SAMN05192529_12042 [Arachidicoccus rhizosphaerae]|jgi:hypothetical protein|uniref:Uncharacterized protein n=1 Tax=Arachidicoccus rhizosphaerae TaxID=551991 RepID=A0A1H4BEA0_9BACT|nr:hypothetical protein [Arachidicoccus rhizosphaerae]SEA46481.1 hypothetical protein SAMN05192529_12042 [Arachidicoccus rhizosphaerae]
MKTPQKEPRKLYTTAKFNNRLFIFIFILFIGLGSLFSLNSCHSQQNEGSTENQYDTIQQNRTNDHTMSSQQHDGVKTPKPDSTAQADTTVRP